MMAKSCKKGFTLTEVLLAVVLMAFTFMPVLGIMTQSIKATEKDEITQRAVALCQEKMNTALQMPFSAIDSNKKHNSPITKNGLTCKLGVDTVEGVIFNSVLDASDYTVDFHVPECDFVAKGNNPNTPNKWFTGGTTLHRVTNMVKRYTVTITWREPGSKVDKSYTLSSLKANLR